MRRKYLIVFASLCLLLFASLVSAQNIPDALLQIAIRAAQTSLNTTEAPLTWRYTMERTRSSSLGCPLVTGTDLGAEIVVYNVTLTFSSGDFNARVSADGALVVPCDARAPLTPTPLVTATPLPGGVTPTPPTCILTPNGGLSNVRSEPSTDGGDATIIGQITLPTPALGRSSDGNWYRIANGWVAAFVVAATGDCGALPIAQAESGDQNPLTEPYCTITTRVAGNLITAMLPTYSYGAAFAAGQTFLVTQATMSEIGALVRVIGDATSIGWIAADRDGTLSPGCAVFLAQAPGMMGADQQCYAMINGNVAALTEPNGTSAAFNVEAGDRYAIRNRAEIEGEGWLQITTFGRLPDGWVMDRTNSVSAGCAQRLNYTDTPRLNPEYRTPYCVATVTVAAPLYIDASRTAVLRQAAIGDRHLVLAVDGANSDLYRLLLRGGQPVWVDANAVSLSAGCDNFLFAPPMSFPMLQCYATINADQVVAYAAPDANAEPVLSARQRDQYAALETTTTAAGRWYRLGTFGLTPEAWVPVSVITLSQGCPYALPNAAQPVTTPHPVNCIITPINAFVNARSQPTSDGTYNGIVGQLISPYIAAGRNADGSWYLVLDGWVAAYLVRTSGDCSNLVVLSP